MTPGHILFGMEPVVIGPAICHHPLYVAVTPSIPTGVPSEVLRRSS